MLSIAIFLIPHAAYSQTDCENEIVITFDEFAPGTQVSDHLKGQGISLISVLNADPQHPDIAVIFDSSNPSGGDSDLGTPNESFGGPGVGDGNGNDSALGNLLIIGENDIDTDEDSLIDDPDDETRGGDILFNFVRPTRIKSITFVDTETKGVAIAGFNNDNSVNFLAGVAALGGNSVQSISLLNSNTVPAARLLISIRESSAIAELVLCPEDAAPFRSSTRIHSACNAKKRSRARMKGKQRLRIMKKAIRKRLSKSGRRSLRKGICG